jgi:hypothetical protein
MHYADGTMTGKSPTRLIVLGMFVFSLLLFPQKLLALEELQYQILKKAGDFEIRQYQPYVVAEILLEGGFQRVGNEGFRRLVAYVDGENRRHQTIPMAAPVGQENVDGKWRVTFDMPSSSTVHTLPAPLDPRIKLVEVPKTLMAALRYSGLWNRSLFEAQKAGSGNSSAARALKSSARPSLPVQFPLHALVPETQRSPDSRQQGAVSSSFEFRVSSFEFRVSSFEFWVLGFGFRVLGFGFWVLGLVWVWAWAWL